MKPAVLINLILFLALLLQLHLALAATALPQIYRFHINGVNTSYEQALYHANNLDKLLNM
jgi:hypothetical protein